MGYFRKSLMVCVGLYLIYVIFYLPFAKAEWFRVETSSPIPNRNEFFIATYFHQGLIDPSIHGSQMHFYVTIVYDFSRIPMVVYMKTAPYQLGARQAHREAEQWLIHIESQKIAAQSRRLFIDASFTGEETLR